MKMTIFRRSKSIIKKSRLVVKIHSESSKDSLLKHLLSVEWMRVVDMFVEGQFRYLILGVTGLLIGFIFYLRKYVS